MGMLPTKGLTLPLMSYGGSSLIVVSAAIGLLLRIAYECSSGQAVVRTKTGKRQSENKQKVIRSRSKSVKDLIKEAA